MFDPRNLTCAHQTFQRTFLEKKTDKDVLLQYCLLTAHLQLRRIFHIANDIIITVIVYYYYYYNYHYYCKSKIQNMFGNELVVINKTIVQQNRIKTYTTQIIIIIIIT